MSDYPDFMMGTLYKAIRADRKEWTVGWYMQKYDAFERSRIEESAYYRGPQF